MKEHLHLEHLHLGNTRDLEHFRETLIGKRLVSVRWDWGSATLVFEDGAEFEISDPVGWLNRAPAVVT